MFKIKNNRKKIQVKFISYDLIFTKKKGALNDGHYIF